MRAARLIVVALAVSACGVGPQEAPEDVPRDRLPAASALPSASSAPRAQARVWGVRDGRLVPVFAPLAGEAPADRLRAVLALAGERPVLTALPAGTRLVTAVRSGDVVDVALSGEPATMPPRRQALALGQLVLTVTEDAAVRRVRVRAGDAALPLRTTDGRTLVRPLTRADFAALAAAASGGDAPG